MKKIFVLALAVLAFNVSFSQLIYSEQPDAVSGKDAWIFSLIPSNNYGDHADIDAAAWTSGGNPYVLRSLFEFDLSSIPSGAVVNNATLSLYHNPTSNNAGHSTLDGSNASYLRRVVDDWDEYSVNWQNQPSTTTSNQVSLPATISQNEDFDNIDVTQLVQDMIDNPSSSFGFMIQLQTEVLYRSVIFASSDNADPTKRPKLVINYTDVTSVELLEGNELIKVYPNPANGELIHFDFEEVIEKASMLDMLGRELAIKIDLNEHIIDISSLSNGEYFLQLKTSSGVYSKKVVVSH